MEGAPPGFILLLAGRWWWEAAGAGGDGGWDKKPLDVPRWMVWGRSKFREGRGDAVGGTTVLEGYLGGGT